MSHCRQHLLFATGVSLPDLARSNCRRGDSPRSSPLLQLVYQLPSTKQACFDGRISPCLTPVNVLLVVTIITFLIVDDTASYRQLLVQLVQTQRDWSVVGEAADGVEAVKLAIRLAPDVVFMDVTLPLMNGIEATRQIKQSVKNTHVLVLSGYDDEEFRQESFLAGASYYLRKEDLDVELIKQFIVTLFPST